MTDRRRAELQALVFALAPIVDAAMGSPGDGEVADSAALFLVKRMMRAQDQARRARRMARLRLGGVRELLTIDVSEGGDA